MTTTERIAWAVVAWTGFSFASAFALAAWLRHLARQDERDQQPPERGEERRHTHSGTVTRDSSAQARYDERRSSDRKDGTSG